MDCKEIHDCIISGIKKSIESMSIKKKAKNFVTIECDIGDLLYSNIENSEVHVGFRYMKKLHENILKTLDSELHMPNWGKETIVHKAVFLFEDGTVGKYHKDTKPTFYKTKVLTEIVLSSHHNFVAKIKIVSNIPFDREPKSEPVMVHLIETRYFLYKNMWKYKLTKISSGPSKEIACTVPPLFKVGLELDLGTFAATPDFELLVLSQHIIEKTRDLLGRYSFEGIKLDVPLKIL